MSTLPSQDVVVTDAAAPADPGREIGRAHV